MFILLLLYLLLSEEIAMFNGLQRYKVSAHSHTVINY